MFFYVTKWATTHGILLLEGSKPERRGHSPRTWTSVQGVGRRMASMSVGREAFLNLKEAQADAQKRFEERHKRAQAEAEWASSAWGSVRSGVPILVHKKPASVSKCRPFTK